MLKILVNECKFDLEITPLDPILIKSGLSTVSGADMAFVKTFKDGKEQVYFPGSSLKGVIRSHGEKIARSLKYPSVCMPFPKEGIDMFCGHKFQKREKFKKISNETAYKDSCPICKLFGSTYFIGRFAIGDAYVRNGYPPNPQQRDGVGIDRFTGGAASGAKFDLEVITEGTFTTTIHIRNFELWQLALIGYIVKDFEEGLIRIGMGTSRGFGRVKGKVSEEGLKISYIGRSPEDNKLYGLGRCTEEKDYGFAENDEISIEGIGEWEEKGIRFSKIFKEDLLEKLWKSIGPKWNSYINDFEIPEAMNHKKF